jgi:hypothetical protein
MPLSLSIIQDNDGNVYCGYSQRGDLIWSKYDSEKHTIYPSIFKTKNLALDEAHFINRQYSIQVKVIPLTEWIASVE